MRSKGHDGLAHWFEKTIGEVIIGLSPDWTFPSTLRVEDQGRFVIGYYHQRYAKAGGGTPNTLPETDTEV